MASVAIAAIGLALKAATFLKDIIEGDAANKKLDKLKESMEQVKKGINDIQKSVEVVLSEVNWSEVITVLNEGVSYIEYSFDRMLEFNKGDKKNVIAFLDSLKLDEISEALHSFNMAMMGEYTLINGGPLMKLFVDRLTPLGLDKLPQSKRFIAADYLQQMLALQAKGYLLLTNAYEVEGKKKKVERLVQEMQDNFTAQVQTSSKFIDSVSYDFQNSGWGDSYFKWYDDAEYVDTHEVKADKGKVVVGMQLYQKGNRIAIKIAQSTPEFNILTEKVSSDTLKDNSDWGEVYYYKLEDDYVDTNLNMLPEGMVVTGVKLYKKSNRLGIKLHGSKIDAITGEFALGETQWQDSPGWGDAYFKGSDIEYCDTHEVKPATLSCIGGARLYNKGNRIAIEIRTRFLRYDAAK